MQNKVTHPRGDVVSAARRVTITNALSSYAYVSNGVKKPFVPGDILREPFRQWLYSSSKTLQSQSDVAGASELQKFRTRLVCTWPTVNQGCVDLQNKRK